MDSLVFSVWGMVGNCHSKLFEPAAEAPRRRVWLARLPVRRYKLGTARSIFYKGHLYKERDMAIYMRKCKGDESSVKPTTKWTGRSEGPVSISRSRL